jgi:hypothetical protein
MSPNSCPFCEQVNPADAKFCNACGGALHLVPCPRCGAVSDVTATVCYQCHGELPGRGTDARDPAAPVAEVSKALPRRTPRVIVGTAVLAAIVVLGYYSVRQLPLVDAPEPQPASSEASGRGGSAGAGVIRQDATAGESTLGKAADSAAPASPETAPPENPLAGPTPAAENPPRADRETVELRQEKPATGLSARPQAADAATAGRRAPPRQELCTEAAAALGLCTMTPDQKKQAEAAAAIKAAIARPEATDAGKAGRQERPGQEACTEAVAALGLCTPIPTQRRE